MKPASIVARALRTPVIASSAALVVVAGHAGVLHVADEMAVAVDEARQDREAAQVDDAGTVRDGLVGAKDGLDAAVRDQDLAVREDLARVDVQEPAPLGRRGDRPWRPMLAAADAMIGPCPPPTDFPFTGNDEADRLLVSEPLALLIGFELDQQVPLQKAFSGPLELQRRIGGAGRRDDRVDGPGGAGHGVPDAAGAPSLPGQHGPPDPGAVRSSSSSATAATRRGSGPRRRTAPISTPGCSSCRASAR